MTDMDRIRMNDWLNTMDPRRQGIFRTIENGGDISLNMLKTNTAVTSGVDCGRKDLYGKNGINK